ncbi:MAG: type IV secretory system conjugative DNA transfer family protein [Lachnospiraceae bacterium]|nr:type IV secretory system conjugative DNA transfer family protein [Lachnospiraceae bacterium]
MLLKVWEYIKKEKESGRAGRLLWMLGGAVLVLFYLIGLILQLMDRMFRFDQKLSYSPFVCLRYGLFSAAGWKLFGLCVAGIVLILIFTMPKDSLRNQIAETDERGVIRKERATYGSARRVQKREAGQYFEIGPVEKVKGMILGQFDTAGREVCAMRAGETDNRNVLVIGCPGTGKSYAIIRSAVLQCMERGESIVVVDPKGELFRDMYLTVKSGGYTTQLYNLVETDYSDAWDCLGECFDEYGDLDSTRAEEFVDIMMRNTRSSEKLDSFWEDGERNLFSMHVNYVVQTYMAYVNGEYRDTISQLIEAQKGICAEALPCTKAIYDNWVYVRLLNRAMAGMWKKRIPVAAISRTMERIQACIGKEDIIVPERRRKSRERLEEFLRRGEPGSYDADAAAIFMEYMCDSPEEVWVFDREHLLGWCKSGLKGMHRTEKRSVLSELLRLAGAGEQEILDVIETIENGEATPKCNMSEVYYRIVESTPTSLKTDFRMIEPSSLAGIAYRNYCDSAEQAQIGYKQGLTTRLSMFKDTKIRRITSNRDIDFARMGEKKTAIFVKISDKSAAYSALTSLFFSFLIKDLSDAYDHSEHPEKRLPVTLLMDELANCGVIESLPVAISSVRGRKIAMVLILQNITQLNKNYGDAASTIISCCDYTVFLGCNDLETAQFFESRAGVATVQVSTERERMKKIGFDAAFKDYDASSGEGQRNVYNRDEILTLPPRRLLLTRRGMYVMELNTFGYDLHPKANGGKLPQMMTTEYMRSKDKYPLYDFCVDSFFCNDSRVAATRTQDGRQMGLANVNISRLIERLCGAPEQGQETKKTEQDQKAAAPAPGRRARGGRLP